MPVSVTDTIKRIIADRDAGIVSGREAVLRLLAEARQQIVAELAAAPADSFSGYHLNRSLAAIADALDGFEAGFRGELKSRLIDSWELGASILPEAAAAAGMQLGSFRISAETLDALTDYAFTRISGVRADAMNRIKAELTLGILGQKTPQDVAGELAAQLKGLPLPKGRFGHPIFKSVAERAEVITGLEMGRAFSMATENSIEAAGQTLPDIRRMWLHAGHPKQARQVHVLMHGQVRKIGKPFFRSTSGGAPVFYPRAPDAPIAEVIRCGCTHIPYLPEWGDAKGFANDFDARQAQANQPKGA